MLGVIKVLFSLLAIMHGTFDLVNQIFHIYSKLLSLGINGGFSGQ